MWKKDEQIVSRDKGNPQYHKGINVAKEFVTHYKIDQYRIAANKCKTQEIRSSAYRKYQIRWKGRLVQKTGFIEEKI